MTKRKQQQQLASPQRQALDAIRRLQEAAPPEEFAEFMHMLLTKSAEGQVITNRPDPTGRINSIRGYRRIIDRAIARAYRGELSPQLLRELSAAAEKGATLLMSEQMLRAQGLQDVEPESAAGRDGGVDMGEKPKTWREVVVARTLGIGPKGEPVDETTTTIKGDGSLVEGDPSESGP